MQFAVVTIRWRLFVLSDVRQHGKFDLSNTQVTQGMADKEWVILSFYSSTGCR